MKRLINISLVFLLFYCMNLTSALAQHHHKKRHWLEHAEDNKEKREQIQAMKVAYITQRIDLVPEEAQKFWPIYNSLENELLKLRQDMRRNYKNSLHHMNQMTDTEAEAIANQLFEFRQKELDLAKNYHEKFKAVLPPKKLTMYYLVEFEFKRTLLDQLKREKP